MLYSPEKKMVQDLDCNIRSPHARFADSFDVQVTPLYLEHVSKIGQHGNRSTCQYCH